MNGSQIIIPLALAILSTGLAVLCVPRAKRNLWFEVVLWLGTALVSFLGAVLAIAAAGGLAVLRGLTVIAVLEVPLIPALLGALGGAFLLTVPLWLMNRFEASDDHAESDGEQAAEE